METIGVQLQTPGMTGKVLFSEKKLNVGGKKETGVGGGAGGEESSTGEAGGVEGRSHSREAVPRTLLEAVSFGNNNEVS